MSDFLYAQRDSNGGAMRTSAYEHVSAAQPHWYAISVRPRFEKKAELQLRSKGIETFLPVIRQLRWWSDRRKVVETPLFSGYEFVRIQISPEQRLRVLQTCGVMNFVGVAARGTAITASQVDDLRRLLDSTAECSIRPFLRTGQRVRIRGGSLDGIEGILQENAPSHLILSIDCIQRSIAIRIEGYDLEPV
jgi:transcription antitermination factor NusG